MTEKKNTEIKVVKSNNVLYTEIKSSLESIKSKLESVDKNDGLDFNKEIGFIDSVFNNFNKLNFDMCHEIEIHELRTQVAYLKKDRVTEDSIKRTVTQHEDYLKVLVENTSDEHKYIVEIIMPNDLQKEVDTFTVEGISNEKYRQHSGNMYKHLSDGKPKIIWVQNYIMSKEEMLDREKNPQKHSKYQVDENIKKEQGFFTDVKPNVAVEFIFNYKK